MNDLDDQDQFGYTALHVQHHNEDYLCPQPIKIHGNYLSTPSALPYLAGIALIQVGNDPDNPELAPTYWPITYTKHSKSLFRGSHSYHFSECGEHLKHCDLDQCPVINYTIKTISAILPPYG